MAISRTTTNKLISYVDKVFTWDKRTMRREGTDDTHDLFCVRRSENNRPRVSITLNKRWCGIYAGILVNGEFTFSDYLKTYKDITMFKAMVRAIEATLNA